MGVYVINLDTDAERLAFIDQQLTPLGVSYARLPAVRGRDVMAADPSEAQRAAEGGLSPSELGCMLSHIAAWRTIAENDDPFGVVIEDDVHFAQDFSEFLDAFADVIGKDEWAIHRLEAVPDARATAIRAPKYQVGKRRAYALETLVGCTGAYAINRATAQRLLDCAPAMRRPIDLEMFDPNSRAISGVTSYQWTPAPCIQDMHVAKRQASGFATSISHIGEEQKIDSALVREFKSLIRPAYTQLYSFALSFSGRRRLQPRFG